MSRSVDRELVERLLEDASLSYREIARRAGCSDWSVRSIARELALDSGMRSGDATADEPPGIVGLAALLGGALLFAGVLWLASRWSPPLEGGDMA